MTMSISAFMYEFTSQIIAITCALILAALWAFQHFQLGQEEMHVASPLQPNLPSHNAARVMGEDLLLAVFVLWVLKPFADLCFALVPMIQQMLEPSMRHLLRMPRNKKSDAMLQDVSFAKYGACSGTPGAHDKISGAQDLLARCQVSQSPSFAASHVQEPMLTWQSLHPKGTALNEGWCVWLEGAPISSESLKIACRNITQRHESLRLKFSFANGPDATWTQQVMPLDSVFAEIFTQLDAANDDRRALQLAEEAFNAPFQIFDGPSARIGVVRVSASKVLFYIVQHHVGTDAVSMPLLYDDLKTQYSQAASNTQQQLSVMVLSGAASLSELDLNMKDKADLGASLEWWGKHLQGGSKLDLPTDHAPKSQASFACVHVPLSISPELSAKILALSKSEGVTVFEILLTLHCCWLCLMSRQADIVTLISHHGRNGKNADGVVGCLRPLLPLRLTPQGSFKELVHAASDIKKDVLGHCGVPTMQLFEVAGIDGNRGQNVLNYYADRYNKAGIAAAAAKAPFADGVQASPVEFQKRSVTFDVELNVSKNASGCLCGNAVFSADLFSEASAQRMAQHFSTMAEAALADTTCNVWDLPLSTPKEEETLDTFHGSSMEAQPTMVELLSKCVQQSFGNIAVEYEPTGEQLTYGELGTRVCGLAAHLTTLGIGPDILCALMLERSIEMVVAIYSVWWAGGAYVPIEPSAPDKYVEIIVSDIKAHNGAIAQNGSNPSLTVLTQSYTLERRALHKIFSNTLSLDTFKPSMPFAAPAPGLAAPSHLCYSIYTSGSTGRPKGVLLQHNGLANYIANLKDTHGIERSDVIMLKTTYIFDVSLCEFGLPLTVAAKLLVAKHEGHKDVAYVVDAVRRCGVTYARFVPSYLDIFLEHIKIAKAAPGGDAELPLRVVGVSGEALHAPTCTSFLQLLPKTDLFDLYGPTEATVDVTQLACTGKALRNGKTIGQPMDGCRIYVATVSNGGRFVRTPVGLHGELLIGGVQVARGYLNLPEQSAKAFIKNPFHKDTGDILYRTGDVVKWNPNGHLVYVGRADGQVKLNGLRIELGEIESAVSKAPGVRECVVKLLREQVGGGARLVAYVSPASADKEQITKHCREALPQHMVPAIVVGIDEWPRTGSGKIDHKQLPVPQSNAEKAEDDPDSLALLAEKIQNLGFVGALGDDEVQQHGWNSFQLMAFHAEMMRNPEKYSKSEENTQGNKDVACVDGETQVSLGVVSIVGHMWCLMMVLVLHEWVVAYWEWYQAVPRLLGPGGSYFQVKDFPILERINANGRFLGDPLFVMLCGIQDMQDVRAGNTGQLFRRMLLFLGLTVVFTWIDKILLQGVFLRNGWVDPSWALDTSRTCGVLNGAIFIWARACFVVVPLFLSMGRCGWIRLNGVVEWPWACLVCAILIPALLDGLPEQSGFGDGSVVKYILSTRSFVVELCPYYFLYPLMAGGICFPRGIAKLKVGRSTLRCCAVTLTAAFLYFLLWRHLKLDTTSNVDAFNAYHVRWRAMLQQSNEASDWPLLEMAKKNFDMYSGAVAACFVLLIATMMPVTPTPVSLMGTRVIGCYVTLPLTLIAAGHFLAPGYVHITGFWRPILVPVGVIATLVLITSVMTAQNLLPDRVVKWASGDP